MKKATTKRRIRERKAANRAGTLADTYVYRAHIEPTADNQLQSPVTHCGPDMGPVSPAVWQGSLKLQTEQMHVR